MRDDEVKQAAETDATVSRLASNLLDKHTLERKVQSIHATENTELCRFLIEMRKVCRDQNMTVKDCINPSYFRHVMLASRVMYSANLHANITQSDPFIC